MSPLPPIDTGADPCGAAEHVAETLDQVSVVGQASAVQERTGSVATITANRITATDTIVAQLLDLNGNTWWPVHTADGMSPAWIVGTGAQA